MMCTRALNSRGPLVLQGENRKFGSCCNLGFCCSNYVGFVCALLWNFFCLGTSLVREIEKVDPLLVLVAADFVDCG